MAEERQIPQSHQIAYDGLDVMIFLISLSSLGTGVALACMPNRFPEQAILLERFSGIMLVAGLVLTGGSLPLFR